MATASVNAGGSVGKCATTLWVGLASRMDAYIRAVMDQITMWFYLIATLGDIGRVHRMWWKAKAQVMHEGKADWSRVRGPMSATICTLDNIGWIPVSPSKWIDHRGNRWM